MAKPTLFRALVTSDRTSSKAATPSDVSEPFNDKASGIRDLGPWEGSGWIPNGIARTLPNHGRQA